MRSRVSLRLAALALAFAVLAPGSARAVVAHPDLSYDLGTPPAAAQDNRLDLYLPDDARPGDERPVVVYVHGGAWAIGDKSQRVVDKIPLFTGAGYVFASINYRLSSTEFDPQAPDPGRVMFPDHPADVGEAIGWLDRNVKTFGGDPERIVLIGHSAGAHLASLVSTNPNYLRAHGVEPWQIAGTVSLDTGAFDVESRISEVGPQARATFYNAFGTPEENAAGGLWAAASPLEWAGPADAPHLLVTQAGAPLRVAENRRMATALDQDPAAVVEVPYDHASINIAVGAADDPAGETAAIMDFVGRSLAAAKAPVAKLRKHPPRKVRSERKRPKVRFSFKAKASDVRFQCRLDRRAYKRCSSPHRTRVAPGRHRFRVRAISERGRVGPATGFRFKVAPPTR